ncbi:MULTISPECIES: nitrite reductase small subunit NirD [unclassified Rhodococcus (in: high G+C Gram-positive bacteria)]|uniref:nitrite reductase small subunit NirD n=1 Tax=unclassified Rhodococcus (in: high G+C Gram-positive bacteria) TaxID=192944 RepID=UPI0009E8716E|nr:MULTISPECIES: nitrite reductase small subunit NirD [unclassified Rhodococcus (in: high G+C Gram-positive bacteria)]
MTVIDSAPRHTHDVRHDLADGEWVTATRLSALTPGRGVAVLLPGGAQVALFRTSDDALFAVSNIDPFAHAAVISRGLVGDRAGEPTVASPLLKQVFSLVTGTCLDDETTSLATYDVTVADDLIAVSANPRSTSRGPGALDSGTETTSP